MEEGSPLRLDEKRQNASPFRPSSLIPRPSPSAFQPSYLLISCSPPLLVVVKRKSRYRGPIFIRPISHLQTFLPSNLLLSAP